MFDFSGNLIITVLHIYQLLAFFFSLMKITRDHKNFNNFRTHGYVTLTLMTPLTSLRMGAEIEQEQNMPECSVDHL